MTCRSPLSMSSSSRLNRHSCKSCADPSSELKNATSLGRRISGAVCPTGDRLPAIEPRPGISPKDFAFVALFSFEIDPHKVLGVTTEASLQEIRDAYKQKAKRFHPD